MKKNCKIFIISAILMIFSAISVYASEVQELIQNEQQEEIILLPEEVTNSKDEVLGEARSSIVSSASSEIIDETGGDIGVIIQTLCHVECTQIRNIAILDRLNEETGNWEEQSRYDFIANKEDFPNEPLTSLINEFTIENQETGYYYRIRGIHSVTTTDGKGQVYSTRTSGLLITEYGR